MANKKSRRKKRTEKRQLTPVEIENATVTIEKRLDDSIEHMSQLLGLKSSKELERDRDFIRFVCNRYLLRHGAPKTSVIRKRLEQISKESKALLDEILHDDSTGDYVKSALRFGPYPLKFYVDPLQRPIQDVIGPDQLRKLAVALAGLSGTAEAEAQLLKVSKSKRAHDFPAKVGLARDALILFADFRPEKMPVAAKGEYRELLECLFEIATGIEPEGESLTKAAREAVAWYHREGREWLAKATHDNR